MLEMSEWTSKIALTDRWDRAAAVLRARSSRELIAVVVVIVFVASLSLGLWCSGLFAVPSLVVPVTPLSQQVPPAPVPVSVPTPSVPLSFSTAATSASASTATTSAKVSTSTTTPWWKFVPQTRCQFMFLATQDVSLDACKTGCLSDKTCTGVVLCPNDINYCWQCVAPGLQTVFDIFCNTYELSSRI